MNALDSKVLRFICPPSEWSYEERKKNLLDQLENWINSQKLEELISHFGSKVPNDLSFKERVKWINDFANHNWDYRKNIGERWNLTELDLPDDTKQLIHETAEELGLRTISDPVGNFNYILPLGGARLSNYDRPLLAKETLERNKPDVCKIIGLSGMRPINEIEIPYLEEYAPGAQTEFEALTEGALKAFDIQNTDFEEIKGNRSNPNLDWTIRNYKMPFKNYFFYSIAAPSSDPSRRANSRDTFKFFLKQFNITSNDKLLLVTTAIYVPFQLLGFIDLALENKFSVDCIGNFPISSFSGYINYLQEIKATINQVSRLVEKYSE